MKTLIVEDELLAQNNLRNLITKQFSDLEIVGMIGSVKGAIEWLKQPENRVDLIFLDVELSDGMCFDIFEQVQTQAKIIITTAYDTYAIKAFKLNCIDYLLKPIDPQELRDALTRYHQLQPTQPAIDIEALRQALTQPTERYKSRFVIRIGDKILLLKSDEIAYIYAEDKSTYAVTREGKRHILDMTLDAIQEAMDPQRFFRISRSQIVAIDAIESISRHVNNRLKINLLPKPEFDSFVSRFRITDFLEWIEGK